MYKSSWNYPLTTKYDLLGTCTSIRCHYVDPSCFMVPNSWELGERKKWVEILV